MSTEHYHNITVVGCGALGSILAAALLQAGESVTVVERGGRFEQIRRQGIVVRSPDGGQRAARPTALHDHLDLPPQDLVFLALKAHQLPAIAPQLEKLLHSGTRVVTLQNGVPWWYFAGQAGPWQDRVITHVDSDGALLKAIPAQHLVGCIAYPAAHIDEDGVVQHVEGNRFPLGAVSGTEDEALQHLSALLSGAGFKAPVLDDLRGEIWLKLWGALAFNPLSMLTRATMAEIATNPGTRPVVVRMMEEAEAIASALGVTMRVPLVRRLAGAERVGAHKTSALQDLERAEPSELDAVLGAVIELGQLTGCETTALETVYGTCALLENAVLAPTVAEAPARKTG